MKRSSDDSRSKDATCVVLLGCEIGSEGVGSGVKLEKIEGTPLPPTPKAVLPRFVVADDEDGVVKAEFGSDEPTPADCRLDPILPMILPVTTLLVPPCTPMPELLDVSSACVVGSPFEPMRGSGDCSGSG